jgi:hypothetical protein
MKAKWLIGLMMLFFAGWMVGTAKGSWYICEADNTAGGNGQSIALGPDGRPQIAYVADNNSVLKYAVWNGSDWDIEVIEGTWGLPSLAVNKNGIPCVVHKDPSSIRYATRTAEGWEAETIGFGYLGWSHSLALLPSGAPAVAWGSADGVKYAHLDSDGWHTEAIGFSGNYTSLAVDSQGNAHIAFRGSPLGVTVASQSGGNWSSTYTGIGGFYVSVAVDASGVPYVSSGYEGLHYATYQGSSWVSDLVDENGYWDTFIAIDPAGHPCIAYCDVNYSLKFARLTETGWQIEPIYGNALKPSIAFDDSGNIYVAFSQGNRLMVASTVPIPEPATLSLLALGGLALIRLRRK